MLQLGPTLRPHGLWPSRLLCPQDSPGKSTGAGCQALLQGIFLTQGSNLSPALAGGFFTAEPSGVPYNQKEGEKPEGYIGKHFFFFFFFLNFGAGRAESPARRSLRSRIWEPPREKKKNTQNPSTGQHPPPARGETWKTLYLKIQDSPDQMRSTPGVPVSLSEARSQQTSRTL